MLHPHRVETLRNGAFDDLCGWQGKVFFGGGGESAWHDHRARRTDPPSPSLAFCVVHVTGSSPLSHPLCRKHGMQGAPPESETARGAHTGEHGEIRTSSRQQVTQIKRNQRNGLRLLSALYELIGASALPHHLPSLAPIPSISQAKPMKHRSVRRGRARHTGVVKRLQKKQRTATESRCAHPPLPNLLPAAHACPANTGGSLGNEDSMQGGAGLTPMLS